MEQKGIKAKNTPAHICAKSDPKYQEPERTIISMEVHRKVKIHDCIANSDNGSLFRLNSQFLNGFKVKRFQELWVPDKVWTKSLTPETNVIWIKEWYYYKLVFV